VDRLVGSNSDEGRLWSDMLTFQLQHLSKNHGSTERISSVLIVEGNDLGRSLELNTVGRKRSQETSWNRNCEGNIWVAGDVSSLLVISIRCDIESKRSVP